MNSGLFQTTRGRLIPTTDTTNNAGGGAYSYTNEHALAQYAFTGTFSKTYYVDPDVQLDEVLKLCGSVSPEFIAKLAVASREKGLMKDMPCILLAHLASRKTPEAQRLLNMVFARVIDNARMLRTFVQMVRSGVTGRKSFGSATKRLIVNWLEARSDDGLFRDQVGGNPSLADIIKMVHPKAARKEREALYGYLLRKEGVLASEYEAMAPEARKGKYVIDHLPSLALHFEIFKVDRSAGVPDVPFLMLTSLDLTTDEWADVFRQAPWHMVRMNLNTAARQGVFGVEGMTKVIADKLRDREAIKRAKVFPYQLLAAYRNVDAGVPAEVREALQDAMEIAIENVPVIDGSVVVCPDVSGSMSAAVTGRRVNKDGKPIPPSKVRCIDVAALVSAAVLRANPLARVLPFEGDVVLYERALRGWGERSTGKPFEINPRDSVMTNATKLASIGGGSTNVSAPLALLNREGAKVDLVIVVSDNESWVDSSRYGRGSATMREWEQIKQRCPKAKLVCIDITPNTHTQALDREDILNVGGWSDDVFETIREFAQGNTRTADHWVNQINATVL